MRDADSVQDMIVDEEGGKQEDRSVSVYCFEQDKIKFVHHIRNMHPWYSNTATTIYSLYMAFNRCFTYSPAVMAGYAAGLSAVTQVCIGSMLTS